MQPSERKALFMVGTGNSERKGIGCVVECERKYYVLTCRDVASPEDVMQTMSTNSSSIAIVRIFQSMSANIA